MSGSDAVGDADDTAFAAMAGTSVLIAVIVALLVPLGGLVSSQAPARVASNVTTTTTAVTTTTTTEPTETTVPLPSPPTADEVEARLVSAGFPSLTATVIDDEVTVAGKVGDDALRRAALGVVQAMDGVGSVVDNLTVG